METSPSPDENEKPPLSLIEAARAADTSTETVRRWAIQRGIGVQDGRAWRIDPDKLGRMIEARRVFRGEVAA